MKIVEIKTGNWMKAHLHQGAAYAILVEENREQWKSPYVNSIDYLEPPALDEAHTWYTEANWNGNREPKKYIPVSRVLEIVRNFTFPSEEKAEFGTFIHACTEIADRHACHGNPETLDLEKIEKMENGKQILGYLLQWQKFKVEERLTGHRVAIECPLISKKGFAGTLDRVYPDAEPDEVVFVYLRESYYEIKRYNFKGLELTVAQNQFLSFLETAREKLGGF